MTKLNRQCRALLGVCSLAAPARLMAPDTEHGLKGFGQGAVARSRGCGSCHCLWPRVGVVTLCQLLCMRALLSHMRASKGYTYPAAALGPSTAPGLALAIMRPICIPRPVLQA